MARSSSRANVAPSPSASSAPSAKGRTGRPKKSTPETRKAILEAVRRGLTREEAAAESGVGRSTLLSWLSMGRAGDPNLATWARAIDQVEHEIPAAAVAPRGRKAPDAAGEVARFLRVLDAAEMVGLEVCRDLDPLDVAAHKAAAIEVARQHLLPFTVYTYTGPRPWFWVNWHHVLTSSFLQRFCEGTLLRGILSQPPRSGKTELAGVRVPAFILGRDPNARVVAGAYQSGLAKKTSRLIRKLLSSEPYRELFPDTVLPTRREVQQGLYTSKMDEWELSGAGGGYKCSGIGGGITGFGGGWLVLDDCLKNRATAESKLLRDKLWDSFNSDWSTRMEPPGAILLNGTRWHEDDPAGRAKKASAADPCADQYEELNLDALPERPEELVPGDPRQLGEPLWPESQMLPTEWEHPPPREELVRRALQYLEGQKRADPYAFSALQKGRPSRREGDLFLRAWTQNRWTSVPTLPAEWVQSWDMKGYFWKKSKAPSRAMTVGQVWMRPFGSSFCYLIDEVRGRWTPAEAASEVARLTALYPEAVRKIFERRGYAEEVADTLSGLIPGIEWVDPTASKAERLQAVEPLWTSGNVWLPADTIRPWVGSWIEELCSLPGGGVWDRCDAMSQVLTRWKTTTTTTFWWET